MILPVGNRILVKRYVAPEPKKSTLILPDSSKDKDKFVIVAIGHGEEVPETLEEGDIIYVEKYAAKELPDNEEPLFIVRAEDIVAVEIIDERKIIAQQILDSPSNRLGGNCGCKLEV